jgi:hypothetical protein
VILAEEYLWSHVSWSPARLVWILRLPISCDA